jgi:hypothetical protein
MIRYEITTKQPGVIIEAELIRKIASTRLKAVAVVYVEKSDAAEFEKIIEGMSGVLKYNAYPPGTGAPPLKDWSR